MSDKKKEKKQKIEETQVEEKPKKRRKSDAQAAAAAAAEDAGGDSTPAAKKAKKEKKEKKEKKQKPEAVDTAAAASEEPENAEAAAPASPSNPNALDNFALSEQIKSLLRSKSIEALFAIQAACFDVVLDGKDVVGRARTGCGKTLAFVLPIVQVLSETASSSSFSRRPFGRAPAVIVLAPTRELAKQVGHWVRVLAASQMVDDMLQQPLAVGLACMFCLSSLSHRSSPTCARFVYEKLQLHAHAQLCQQPQLLVSVWTAAAVIVMTAVEVTAFSVC
jgi:Rad3-related DNA helicase